jgi:carbonic anhydrase
VFNAHVGRGCYISSGAQVTGGVRLAPDRFVPLGEIVDTQAKANALGPVSRSQREFAEEVQHVNREFPAAYIAQFGCLRCSCGFACSPDSLLKQ